MGIKYSIPRRRLPKCRERLQNEYWYILRRLEFDSIQEDSSCLFTSSTNLFFSESTCNKAFGAGIFGIMVKSASEWIGLTWAKQKCLNSHFNLSLALLQLYFKWITSVKQQDKNKLSPYVMKVPSRCPLLDW